MKNEFQIIADLIEKDKKVLDVGCAGGKHKYNMIRDFKRKSARMYC